MLEWRENPKHVHRGVDVRAAESGSGDRSKVMEDIQDRPWMTWFWIL